jgi:hypothetical protein
MIGRNSDRFSKKLRSKGAVLGSERCNFGVKGAH